MSARHLFISFHIFHDILFFIFYFISPEFSLSYFYSSLLFYFMSFSTCKLHVIVLSMSSMRCQPAIDLWARSTLAVVAHLQRDSSAVRPTTPITWLESKVLEYFLTLFLWALEGQCVYQSLNAFEMLPNLFPTLKILAFAVKFGRCLFVSFRFCRFTFFSLISFPKGQSENSCCPNTLFYALKPPKGKNAMFEWK